MAMPDSPTTSATTQGSENDAETLWEEQRPIVLRGVSLGALGANAEPDASYSIRLVRPFLRLLRGTTIVPAEIIAELDGLDQDHRLPAAIIHQMLDAVVSMTGDPDIGLKGAMARSPGDGGVLEYAVSSASTVNDAIAAAARYAALMTDALEMRLEIIGKDAFVRLDNRVVLPRAGMDFQVGAIYRAFSCVWAAGAGPSLRVYFQYPKPENTAQFAYTFGETPVEFGAAFTGFQFDAVWLTAKLSSAESTLHDVILRHAEKMLAELPRARKLTERVRSAILTELAGGNPSVAHVAPRLHMSARTLERRLEREGTTFSELLDEMRKGLALRYVGSQDLAFTEIAFLLGFSQVSSFHRAFKRWTNETPLNYRRARLGMRGSTPPPAP
jgi:AraC-like DNA-binding protein